VQKIPQLVNEIQLRLSNWNTWMLSWRETTEFHLDNQNTALVVRYSNLKKIKEIKLKQASLQETEECLLKCYQIQTHCCRSRIG
jgi:hypothetical protein